MVQERALWETDSKTTEMGLTNIAVTVLVCQSDADTHSACVHMHMVNQSVTTVHLKNEYDVSGKCLA